MSDETNCSKLWNIPIISLISCFTSSSVGFKWSCLPLRKASPWYKSKVKEGYRSVILRVFIFFCNNFFWLYSIFSSVFGTISNSPVFDFGFTSPKRAWYFSLIAPWSMVYLILSNDMSPSGCCNTIAWPVSLMPFKITFSSTKLSVFFDEITSIVIACDISQAVSKSFTYAS